MTKSDLPDVVLEALTQLGGAGKVAEVAKWIWVNHEVELRASGDLFYTWQYDIRWAADQLRKRGLLKSTTVTSARRWEVA